MSAIAIPYPDFRWLPIGGTVRLRHLLVRIGVRRSRHEPRLLEDGLRLFLWVLALRLFGWLPSARLDVLRYRFHVDPSSDQEADSQKPWHRIDEGLSFCHTVVLPVHVGVFASLKGPARSPWAMEDRNATANLERDGGQYRHIKGGLKQRGDSEAEARRSRREQSTRSGHATASRRQEVGLR